MATSLWDGGEAIPAHPQVANEAWVDTVRIAERKGYKQRYRRAETRGDVLKMHDQNRAISRVSFGMPQGYERIIWSKTV